MSCNQLLVNYVPDTIASLHYACMSGLSQLIEYTCHELSVKHAQHAVLGVTRYLCNALCNIITFVVTK